MTTDRTADHEGNSADAYRFPPAAACAWMVRVLTVAALAVAVAAYNSCEPLGKVTAGTATGPAEVLTIQDGSSRTTASNCP